jgi:hypothetical protein
VTFLSFSPMRAADLVHEAIPVAGPVALIAVPRDHGYAHLPELPVQPLHLPAGARAAAELERFAALPVRRPEVLPLQAVADETALIVLPKRVHALLVAVGPTFEIQLPEVMAANLSLLVSQGKRCLAGAAPCQAPPPR